MRRDPVKSGLSLSRPFSTRRNSKKSPGLGIHHRRLGCEPLEDRRLLSIALNCDSRQVGESSMPGWEVVAGDAATGPTESQRYAWKGYLQERGASSGGAQVTVAEVPAYLWHHGCAPTAAGMVVGYWDMHGYGGLIPLESNTQTSQVDTAIASAEHYDDYSLPIDDQTPTILADRSELGGAHSPHNCLADWMHTSWSLDGNRYGWTYMSRVDDAIDSYCNWKEYAGFTATNETWGAFTWNDFVGEINSNRPMVFVVDTDGNGETDHSIAAIGYDSTANRYACYDTWDTSVHWYDFRQIAAGQPWGIYGATYVSPPSDDAYEENDTLATAFDLSSRQQAWLSAINGRGTLADDADWYRIDVAPGYEHLIVDLRFTHSQGDIDIQVYDAGGGLVTGSYGTTDNEYVDCVVPASGTYYLKIYCTHVANQYDLWWDDQLRITDDNYEDNDTKAMVDGRPEGGADSANLGLLTSQRIINNLAMADTADWYKFRMEATGTASDFVRIDFTHSQGDLNLMVYQSDGTTLVGSSIGVTNREEVSLNGQAAGTYYVRVYGFNGAFNPNYTLTIDPPIGDTRVSVSGYDLLIDDVVVGGKDDSLTLSFDAAPTPDELVIHDPNAILASDIPGAAGSGTHTLRVPVTAFGGPGFTQVIVNTLAGDDTLTVDFSGGNLIPFYGAVHYDGGANGPDGDRVRVVGTPAMTGWYDAFGGWNYDESVGSYASADDYGTVTLVGIERKEISSVHAVCVDTWMSGTFALSAGTVGGVNATTLTGTSGSVSIGPLTVYDVTEFVLDPDKGSEGGHDYVLLSGDHMARGLTSMTINLGTGVNYAADDVEVSGVVDLGADGRLRVIGDAVNLALSGGSITAERVQLPVGSQLSGTGMLHAALVGVDRIEATGALTLGNGAYGGFSFAGTLLLNNSTVTLDAADFARLGTVTTINGGVLDAANGIVLGAGSTLQGAGTVDASVAAQVGSTIVATGSLVLGDANAYDGFISDGRLHVGTYTVTIRDRNEAALASLTTLGSGSMPGALTIPNSAVVNFGETLTGYGTITTPNDAVKPLVNNGDILGDSIGQPITLTGYVKGVGNFDNVQFTGTYSPGLSPTRQYVGSLRFADTCTLLIEIGGTQPGAQYDQLVSSGTLDLGGTLDVDLTGGYVPPPGSAFEIMTSTGCVLGTFSTESLPALPPDRFWHVSYSAQAVTLEVKDSPPTVDIVDVSPDPRTTAVDTTTIVFTEAITGFDLADLSLTRDGGSNLLTGSQTLSTGDNTTWELGNLAGLTSTAGSYVLTLSAAGSGITDLAGNALAADASDAWTTNSTIAGRYVFYNHSSFDGNDPAANAADDAAIATDKQALLPGGASAFLNYTSFVYGINGIMVDIAGLPASSLGVGDLLFKAGNTTDPGGWSSVTATAAVDVRRAAGVDGSDRVTITWPDYNKNDPAHTAAANQWLQVTVLANGNTGLAAPEVFYFGNAIGESGVQPFIVNAGDMSATRVPAPTFPRINVGIEEWYDYNRDNRVNMGDLSACRSNVPFVLAKLTAPTLVAAGEPAVPSAGEAAQVAAGAGARLAAASSGASLLVAGRSAPLLVAEGRAPASATPTAARLPVSSAAARDAVFSQNLDRWDPRLYADLAWSWESARTKPKQKPSASGDFGTEDVQQWMLADYGR